MNVKVAKTAGFCFGVERAVNKVYELIEQGKGRFIRWVLLFTMNL